MFFCDKCADKNKWPKSYFSKSYGRCEVCEKTAICNDVRSSALPYPNDEVPA